MKFAHLGDCHLGSWRQPELQELNLKSFQKAIEICINEKVEFILIAGDLFDSAYPPVEILKQTFGEFRKIKEAGIKCYMIAGSHDFSISGKTFLDVLEKAGLSEICKYEEIENSANKEDKKIILRPIKHKVFEIYGYPGKKSGLEINDLKRLYLPDSPNFRILMLHTSLKEAVGNLPIESISMKELPKAEFYALSHLHIRFEQKHNDKPIIYSGPIFPNSFQELEDLGAGSFYIIESTGYTEAKRHDIRLKETIIFSIELTDALKATQQIINELSNHDLKDKIVLLRLYGTLKQGTNADIDYAKIKQHLDEQKAYSFLKNTHKLNSIQEELKSDISFSSNDMAKIEEILLKEYEQKNPDRFNNLIGPLMHSLELPKQEDEKTIVYESRLFSEINKILGVDLKSN